MVPWSFGDRDRESVVRVRGHGGVNLCWQDCLKWHTSDREHLATAVCEWLISDPVELACLYDSIPSHGHTGREWDLNSVVRVFIEIDRLTIWYQDTMPSLQP